jgi:hypothetical protein
MAASCEAAIGMHDSLLLVFCYLAAPSLVVW